MEHSFIKNCIINEEVRLKNMQAHLKRHTKQTHISFCAILFGLLLEHDFCHAPTKGAKKYSNSARFLWLPRKKSFIFLFYYILFILRFCYFKRISSVTIVKTTAV